MSRPGGSLRESVTMPLVLLHAASWLALLAHGRDWVGGWMNGVDQVAGTVVIVGPVLSGLTADAYARRSRTCLPALVIASRHPVRGWYTPVVRLWALATANLVLVLGEAAVLVASAGVPLSPRPVLMLPLGALVLACHALVGMAVGLRLGPRLAGAVAGTASFALFLLAVAQLAPRSFVIGGATDDLSGQRYRVDVLICLAATSAVTAVAVATLTGWDSYRRRTRVGLLIVCLTLATGLSQDRVVDLDRRFEPVGVDLACRGSAPEVCVPVDTPRSLPSATRALHRLAGPLHEAGAQLPERWVAYWGQPFPQGAGVLSMRSGALLGTRSWDSDLVRSLTKPAWCRAEHVGVESQRSLDVRLLLERWIAFRNGLGETSGARSWFSSPASQVWVRTTYAQLRRCDLAALRFPVGSR